METPDWIKNYEVKDRRPPPDEPTSLMLTAGARSIGNSVSVANHIERAKQCWRDMITAFRDGTLPRIPNGE